MPNPHPPKKRRMAGTKGYNPGIKTGSLCVVDVCVGGDVWMWVGVDVLPRIHPELVATRSSRAWRNPIILNLAQPDHPELVEG